MQPIDILFHTLFIVLPVVFYFLINRRAKNVLVSGASASRQNRRVVFAMVVVWIFIPVVFLNVLESYIHSLSKGIELWFSHDMSFFMTFWGSLLGAFFGMVLTKDSAHSIQAFHTLITFFRYFMMGFIFIVMLTVVLVSTNMDTKPFATILQEHSPYTLFSLFLIHLLLLVEIPLMMFFAGCIYGYFIYVVSTAVPQRKRQS